MADPKPSHWNDGIRSGAGYMHIGIQSALNVVLFTGGGILADRWLDTSPWLTVIGALIGVVGLFAILFRAAQTLGNTTNGEPPRPRT